MYNNYFIRTSETVHVLPKLPWRSEFRGIFGKLCRTTYYFTQAWTGVSRNCAWFIHEYDVYEDFIVVVTSYYESLMTLRWSLCGALSMIWIVPGTTCPISRGENKFDCVRVKPASKITRACSFWCWKVFCAYTFRESGYLHICTGTFIWTHLKDFKFGVPTLSTLPSLTWSNYLDLFKRF